MPSTNANVQRSASCSWIPPPALTSLPRKITRNIGAKGGKFDSSQKSSTESQQKLDAQLTGVLKEIMKLKEEILSSENEKELHGQHKKLVDMKASLEKVRDTAEQAVEKLHRIQVEKSKIESVLESVKNELVLKAEDNIKLNKHQEILTSRLRLVEESASEAIKSIIPISEFMKSLNVSKKSENELNEKYLRDVVSKLVHLVNMNQLVLSSVNTMEKETVKTTVENKNEEQVSLMKREIEHLQNHMAEDRKKIIDLQKQVEKTREPTLHDKERNSIRIQKERANKYLSVVDSLKGQLFQKNIETNNLAAEINSLKLQNSQLKSEKDRLEIEKNTLKDNLVKNIPQTVAEDRSDQRKMEELSSKLSQAIQNINSVEAENVKLKSNLTKAEVEIQQLRMETNQLKFGFKDMVNKNTQTSSTSDSGNADSRIENTRIGMELRKQLQDDKINIMQSLKDLERKLEISQQTNVEFRNEIATKEDALKQIHMKLQEKMEENQTLRHLLESALADVRKYSNYIDQKATLLDQANLAKVNDLEKQLYDSKRENDTLKQQIAEMDKKYRSDTGEIQERLELTEKSKNTMQEYVRFLKTSYASVFGDCLEAYPVRNDYF